MMRRQKRKSEEPAHKEKNNVTRQIGFADTLRSAFIILYIPASLPHFFVRDLREQSSTFYPHKLRVI